MYMCIVNNCSYSASANEYVVYFDVRFIDATCRACSQLALPCDSNDNCFVRLSSLMSKVTSMSQLNFDRSTEVIELAARQEFWLMLILINCTIRLGPLSVIRTL